MFSFRTVVKAILSVSLVLTGCLANAETVDQEDAIKIAHNFMKRSLGKEYKVKDVLTFDSLGFKTMYAINFENGGFVLLSASYKSDPILAYSKNSHFNKKDSIENIGVIEFLYDCETKILEREGIIGGTPLRSDNVPDANILQSQKKWDEWANENAPSYSETPGISINAVSNLLNDSLRGGNVSWNQSYCSGQMEDYDKKEGKWYICNNPNNISYDAMLPAIEDQCEHALAGCVPVAIAQVLWKWKYPEKVNFIYKGQEFETNYCWDSMPARLDVGSSIRNMVEISTLLRDCGYMLEASFGCAGTSSSIEDIQKKMIRTNLIGYNCYDVIYTTSLSNRAYGTDVKSYANSELANIFQTELIAGRPVIVSSYAKLYPKIYPDAWSGHSFLVSGFEKQPDGTYFKCNFGWGGRYDDVMYNLDFSSTIDSTTSNVSNESTGSLFAHSQKKGAIIGLSPKRDNQNGEHTIIASCETATISESGIGRLSFNVKNANSYILTIKYKGYQIVKLSSTLEYYREQDVVLSRRTENIFEDGNLELWYSSNAKLFHEVTSEDGTEKVPTEYQVTFFNNYGEIKTYTGNFVDDNMTGDKDIIKSSDVIVYPNPANDFINVESVDPIKTILVTNPLGIIIDKIENCNSKLYNVHVGDYPKGIYTLTLVTETSKVVKQIVVE